MKKLILALIFLLSFSVSNHAQQKEKKAALEIEQLRDQLKTTALDSTRIRMMNQLSSQFIIIHEIDSAKKYAAMTLHYADDFIVKSDHPIDILHYKKLKAQSILNIGQALYFENSNLAFDTLNFALKLWKGTGDKTGIASAYESISSVYELRADYTRALSHLDQSLNYFKEVNRKDKEAEIYHTRGLVKRYMGNYGDALEDNLLALKIARELRDSTLITETLLANAFNYMYVKKFAEAKKNQQEALKIFISQNDSTGIATTYSDMGRIQTAVDHLEEALKHHKAALAIRLKLTNYTNIAHSYNYVSEILTEMDKLEEAYINIPKALNYAKLGGELRCIMKSYRIAGNVSKYLNDYDNSLLYYDSLLQISINNNNLEIQALTLTNIGELYRRQGNPKKAIASFLEAEELVLSEDFISLSSIYEKMNRTYFNNKDYKNAYRSLLKYQKANDSLIAAEKIEKITGLTQQLIFENNLALQKASQDKQLLIQEAQIRRQTMMRNVSIIGLLLVLFFAFVLFWRFRENRKLNVALEKSITDLKATQSQLIQSEKMASLGELTAGIAHEIQNPLNFVNNFAEVTGELVDEMNEEIENGDFDEVKLITKDVKQNLQLINVHGKRADSIVKGMLQHSRNNKGLEEPTDINKLADEYLRLAFHGLRAKDKTFNANFETHFDKNMGIQQVVPQDIGRVILNLITNAFYAVNEKKNAGLEEGYKPNVIVTTKKLKDTIVITVKDNGNGIPENILNKLFQPFFSTKPSGQGTGLGLSLSYDIVKAKGGEIKVSTEEGKFTEFKIILPITDF